MYFSLLFLVKTFKSLFYRILEYAISTLGDDDICVCLFCLVAYFSIWFDFCFHCKLSNGNFLPVNQFCVPWDMDEFLQNYFAFIWDLPVLDEVSLKFKFIDSSST
jgi:hypothetical protein